LVLLNGSCHSCFIAELEVKDLGFKLGEHICLFFRTDHGVDLGSWNWAIGARQKIGKDRSATTSY
jgi:hypothetical protein